jgi:cytochrome c biogenesis protein
MIGWLPSVARGLASLRLTLACLVAAGAVALAGEIGGWPVGSLLAIPFAVLCLNLLASIATSPRLRCQAGLLIFHLALAGLAMLAAVDRLVRLTGHVEVTEGTAFDAGLVVAQPGPLHRWRLDEVRFVQAGFTVDYAPGVRRRETVSTVLVPRADGGWRRVDVGDDQPLVAGRYRFYTSFNKGFAPLLSYTDARGITRQGTVHLPSYPLNYYRQGNEWILPDESKVVKLWLRLPEPVYVEDAAWRFRKPEDAVLVVMDGETRHELRPGGAVALGDGVLRYEGLRTWMGYTISYNPVAPWMLAAAVVGVLGFAWHVGGKLRGTPWQKPHPGGEAADVA